MTTEDIIKIIKQQQAKCLSKHTEEERYGSKLAAEQAYGGYLATAEILKAVKEASKKQ